METKIKEVIEKDIRQYIEGDGGSIEFVKYKDGIVYVNMGGACRNCPSVTSTLKDGVDVILREQLDFVTEVRLATYNDIWGDFL